MSANLNKDNESSENLGFPHFSTSPPFDPNQTEVPSGVQDPVQSQLGDQQPPIQQTHQFVAPQTYDQKANLYFKWSLGLLIGSFLLSLSAFYIPSLLALFILPANIAGIITGIKAKQYGKSTSLPLLHTIYIIVGFIFLLPLFVFAMLFSIPFYF